MNGTKMPELEALAALLVERGESLALAESCTGGLIAKLATDLPGSSRWLERGLVTYSNQAKNELLGVPLQVFEEHGAVSQPCVMAMASGLIANSHAHWGVAVTGIAGPDGGSPGRPVGTVWMAWIRRDSEPEALSKVFDGDRDSVRRQTAHFAFRQLLDKLREV